MDILIKTNTTTRLPLAKKYVDEDVNIITEIQSSSGTIEITENGEHDVSNYAIAEVNVQPTLQEKTVTENGEVIADAGYDGLSKVTVNVASSGAMDRLQWKCDNLKSLYYEFAHCSDNGINDVLIGLDTSKVEDFRYAFYQCSGLTDLPHLDFKNATTLSMVFTSCSNLKNLPTLDLSKATSLSQMFYGCRNLLKADFLNTSNVTSMYGMFEECNSLLEILNLDTSNCSDMRKTFYDCYVLKNLPTLDLSKATSLSQMFYKCKALPKISLVNTSGITKLEETFESCESLTEVSISDTSNVTEMPYTFSNCKALTVSPQLNTSNVTKMRYMFYNCTSLETVSGIDMINVTDADNMFASCKNLTNLTLTNINTSLRIGSWAYGTLLTVDSLINTIAELINTGSSRTLTMDSTNLDKLADTYVKLIEDDGSGKLPFEVCESTDEGAMLITDYVGLKNWSLA